MNTNDPTITDLRDIEHILKIANYDLNLIDTILMAGQIAEVCI